MKEIELKVLKINKAEMIKRLESLQAEKKFDKVQKRYVYDFNPPCAGKWIRLRTNGVKTTLTIKNYLAKKIDGCEELEVEVNDFAKTNDILNELGYEPRSFQENRRCQYILNGVEIDLDSWPYIPDYMEIEGKNEEEVYKTLEILGFKKEDAVFDDADSLYKRYGYDLEAIKELKLEEDR